MTTVAIIGAGGFIGIRAVEMLHLSGRAEVRPVVRTTMHLAPLSRFGLDCRVADASDEEALVPALTGCDAVVHAIAGGPAAIVSAIAPSYRAARRAGVRRFVYLSSASVHGQAPAPGTHEDSPLSDRQPIAYNNAKVRAERRLQQLRDQGGPEVVVLRPGIVFGPRSSWIGTFADALLAGDACIVDDGRGICNSLYIDNLVEAIWAAIHRDGVDRHAFLLVDREVVTWGDLFRPVVEGLGYRFEELPRLAPVTTPPRRSLAGFVQSMPLVRGVASRIPRRFRRAAWAGWRASRDFGSSWKAPDAVRAGPTFEMSLLQTCATKLPSEKAHRMLGYEPTVSFSEGCRRTVAWLEFAGYPVAQRQ